MARRSGYPGSVLDIRRKARTGVVLADLDHGDLAIMRGRTNKPYFSTIARLESGAVEVSSLWRPVAELRPLPLLPAWIERSIS